MMPGSTSLVQTPPPSSDIHAREAATIFHGRMSSDLIGGSRIDSVGAYRILRELGVGGMGVVYEAVDQRLKRRAAIKMIRGGAVSGDAVRRFQTEAEAVAQAHHPNIVQIYEVGWCEGQPFVVLEYLPGGSLHAKAANKPQPPQEAADLVRKLADAMNHAHRKGVIHRDLKPANILFAGDGTPKISDFGAARLTQEGQDSNAPGMALTRVGEVIGTPQYMAPEQARGSPGGITPAVDVYALGAVLYHLLTGRPPHDGPDPFDVMNAVVRNDPIAPRRLVPKVPRDLEIICLKALEKHPANRYASAAAMADDLSRYLAGESIQARTDSVLLRLWKKARRRPLVSGLIAGIVLVALAGFSGVVWQWQQAVRMNQRAEDANAIAQLEAQRAAQEAANARRETREKEQNLYRSQVSEVALLLTSGDFSKAKNLLSRSGDVEPGKPDPRHWEWHHLNRLAHNHLWMTDVLERAGPQDALWTHSLAVSPNTKYLALSGGNPYIHGAHFDLCASPTLYLIDTVTGRIVHTYQNYQPQAAVQMVWRDDATLVTTMINGGIRVYRMPECRLLHEWTDPVGPFTESFTSATGVSPDGRFVWRAIAPRTLALFDTVSGAMARTFDFDSPLRMIPFVEQSKESWRIVLGTFRAAYVIDPHSGRTLLEVPGECPHVAAIDGTCQTIAWLLREQADDRIVKLEGWNLESKTRLWSNPRPSVSELCRYQFSPDGDRLAELYNSGACLRMLDPARGTIINELRGHTTRILNYQFSPDGRHIATASNDGSVRVWHVQEATEIARLRGHGTGARVVAYDPNGWRLYSGGMDSNAIAWDLTRERSDGTRLPYSARQGSSDGGAFSGGLWFGPDSLGRYLDTTNGTLFIFDPVTFTPQRVVSFEGMTRRAEKTATDFALSGDARFLLGPAGEFDRMPVLWNAETGAIVRRIPGISGKPRLIAAALNADGSRAAAMLSNLSNPNQPERQFLIWDTAIGEVIHNEMLTGFSYTSMVFDPVKPRLFLGVGSMKSRESGFHIFDLATKTRGKLSTPQPTLIRNLAISADGRWVAGINQIQGSGGPGILAFETSSSSIGWRQDGVGPATGLAFSPDGQRLALARFDDCLAIYDVRNGAEVFFRTVPSTRHGDYAFPARVAFSPDGRSLAMNHSNAQLSVWLTDDWTGSAELRLASRRVEAEGAAFAFHLRAAQELARKPAGFGYRFHASWLNRLAPPNELLQLEWRDLQSSAP